jgi:hypothetical protein
MGVSYRGGMSPERIAAGLKRRQQIVLEEVEQIVQETVLEAEGLQKELLDRAVTRGGAERFSRGRGGSAGRNDSGDMIRAIDSDTKRSGRTRVEGRFGWLRDKEAYYGIQDFGGNGIPAAHSLLDSFLVAREKFKARMRGVGRG